MTIGKAYEWAKANYPERLMLFREGDMYYAYYFDAYEIAKICGTTTFYRYGKHDCTCFKCSDLDGYLPKLIKAGKFVAITDDPKYLKWN